jgi:hypothetical protein
VVIRITKQVGGGTVLRCVRADGSETWQRQDGDRAVFFALHDLTHFAVETELGYRRGFYGLIAHGWEIEETTGKTARGPLPAKAVEVEYLVSAFSAERSSGSTASPDEFNQLAKTFARSKGMASPRELSSEELERVRGRFAELATKWQMVAPGDSLELRLKGT